MIYKVIKFGIFLFVCKIIIKLFFKKKINQNANVNKKKIKKLIENIWKYFFHSLSATLIILILYNYELENKYVKNICIIKEENIHNMVKSLYGLEIVYYIMELFDFEYLKRKDWFITLNHHVITIILLLLSYANMFTHVGLKVLLLHDISDVILYGVKIIDGNNSNDRAKRLGFILFSISFLILRLLIFPVHIIYNCYIESQASSYVQRMLVLFLSMLFVMHMLWFSYIMKIINNWMKTGSLEKDIREE